MSSAEALAAVEAWLADAGVEATRPSATGFDLTLSGERKRTLPVHIEVGERTLTVQALFLRAPDERAGELYAYLLSRNLRSYVARFALHPDGDVLLLAVLPLAAVDAAELDRVMGQLLATAEEAFEHALRTGFGAYIAREQAWRQRAGLPRNPIT